MIKILFLLLLVSCLPPKAVNTDVIFDSYEFTNGNNRVFQLNYMSKFDDYGSIFFPDTNVVRELTLNNGAWAFYGFGYDFSYSESTMAPEAGCGRKSVNLDGFPKLVELDVDQANCGFLNNTRYFAGTYNDESRMVSPFNRIKFELCDGAIVNANACTRPGKSGSMTVSLLTKEFSKNFNRAVTTSSKDYINKDGSGNDITCISFQEMGGERTSSATFALPISYGLTQKRYAPIRVNFFLGSSCEGSPHRIINFPQGIDWTDGSRVIRKKGNLPSPATKDEVFLMVRDDKLAVGEKCLINANCSSNSCDAGVTDLCQ